MGRKTLLILILVTLVPSLLIRLHPTTSESFQYDAVVSQIAAGAGAVANAFDHGDTFVARRFHPPLLSYIIELNNRLCGDDAFRARIFSIVFGSLACLVVAIAIALLLPAGGMRVAAAIMGGWLLCVLPVHLYVSRTSNWDAVYGCFATASLLCLALYVSQATRIRLQAAAMFGALAFLTCELGLSLLPAFACVCLLDMRRMDRVRTIRRWSGVLLLVAVVFALLWPGGFLELDLGRTLVYRWWDSTTHVRNLPWYAFYTELLEQSPAFTLFVVAGIVITLVVPIRQPGARTLLASRLSAPALPFWIYAATVFLLSLRQRLVYVHHIVDMFPPLVVAVCMELTVRAQSLTRTGRRWALGIAAGVVALSTLAALNPDPGVVGPQEHPGFLGVRDALRDYPGAKIYCYDTVVLGYYLPGASIEGGTSRLWTADDVAHAKQMKYDFVVFDRTKLGAAYSSADSLVSALAPEYHLRWTITHRRTGAPVAWILSPQS